MPTVPAGSLSKAALVGANTVKGPAPFRVSTNPAAFTAATRVVWSAELTALSIMSRELSIAAPPTIGFIESILFICIFAEALPLAIAIETAANSSMRLNLFTVLLPSFSELDLCELGGYTEGLAKRIARQRKQEQEAGGHGLACRLLLPSAPDFYGFSLKSGGTNSSDFSTPS